MSFLKKMRPLAAIAALVAMAAACSSSKSGGSGDSPTGPSASQTAKLRTSDVLSGGVVAGATVAGSGLTTGTTDSGGSLTLTTTISSTYGIDVAGAGYLTRNTLIKVPGNDASISLIPASFDLTAFDQMFRADTSTTPPTALPLRRWTSVPALRVISRVVEFSNTGTTYVATDEALTQSEIDALVANMNYGLPPLSGGQLSAFSTVTTQSVAAGEAVPLLTEGRISIARCRGLAEARGSAGLAQTLFVESTNVIVGASLCVDRDNDVTVVADRLAVRLHELGHALGALHVTARANVLMTPRISVTDITPWDREAAKIAYSRQPGSRTPDRDPSSYSTNNLRLSTMIIDGCRVRH